MSVAHEVHTGAIPAAPPSQPAPKPVPIWMRPRVYRYGFLAFILIVWELVGPLINPIFFSYPSKIALAFYELTFVTGELQHYMVESLLILFYGLGIAILVGVPLAILMARWPESSLRLSLPPTPRGPRRCAVLRPEGDALVARLRALVERLRPGHPSPIVPFVFGEEETTSSPLTRQVPPRTPRSDPAAHGGPRHVVSRVTLSAAHTEDQVDVLAFALDEIRAELQTFGVIVVVV